MKRVNIAGAGVCVLFAALATSRLLAQIGVEVAIPVHLQDGQEYTTSILHLIRFGEQLFTAMWTVQEGGGRPLTKGTGSPLSDPSAPLVFPRQFNRVSAPETNSCSGCHNKPVVGGGGDIVGNVFVLGQRFDFATFDPLDGTPTRGTLDEIGRQTTLQTISNARRRSQRLATGVRGLVGLRTKRGNRVPEVVADPAAGHAVALRRRERRRRRLSARRWPQAQRALVWMR